MLNSYFSFFKQKLNKNFEIIIVPNNCKDRTEEITKNFSKGKSEITIKTIKNKVGKGGAVLSGFKVAKGDFIGFVDADESTAPEEFYKLFISAQGFEGAIASRRAPGSKIYPRRTFAKELSSRVFNLFTWFLFGLKYQDTQCGAKVFSKRAVNIILNKVHENNWIFDVAILSTLKGKGLKVIEVPINWRDAEGSKLSFIEQIKSLKDLIKLRFSKSPK